MDDKIINLLVIDDSFDSEELIVSKLRSFDYTARSSRAEDEEDLTEVISKHIPEIVIHFEHMELFSLKETIDFVNKETKAQNCRSPVTTVMFQ